MKPRIAIFDYKIISINPIGGCHLRMIRDLCEEYDFTVFAVEFENPCPERVQWIRIPAPTRPLALLFIVFHLLAPIYYWYFRTLRGCRFDILQMVESNLAFGDISYSQFCHRAYLRDHWGQSRASGPRGWMRWLDHKLHSLAEARIFRNVRRIVVPSVGLARELRLHYPQSATKICILPNPVDTVRLQRPIHFNREALRSQLGWSSTDICLLFIALGQFERKGLPILLDALREVADLRIRLLVAGGAPDLVSTYRGRVKRDGIESRVRFIGIQKDIAPYLWAADAFILPSFYETFSLVSFEAAAAGLPVIATRLYGLEEFLVDNVNGFSIDRTVQGVSRGIGRLAALPLVERQAMGLRGQSMLSEYVIKKFSQNWRDVYRDRLVG